MLPSWLIQCPSSGPHQTDLTTAKAEEDPFCRQGTPGSHFGSLSSSCGTESATYAMLRVPYSEGFKILLLKFLIL